MEINDTVLKDKFVQEMLSGYGKWLIGALSFEINQKTLLKTGDMNSSVDFKVSKMGGNWRIEVSFLTYGRLIEINFFKRKKDTTLQTIKKLYQVKSREDLIAAYARKTKKDTRWYSHTVYGSLNTLYAHLSYGFTEEVMEELKNSIKETQQWH